MKPVTAAVLLVIIVAGLIIFICQCKGQQVATHDYPVVNGERALLIKGKIAGDWKTWLVIEAHNGPEWKENGFDPSYVRVLTDYKPLFRHLPNGQWEICFTSEIAENIP